MKKNRKNRCKEVSRAAKPANVDRAGTPSPSWALAGVFAVTAAGAAGFALPTTVAAQTVTQSDTRQQTRAFAIAAGSLDSALAAFSRTTGIAVTDPGDIASSVKSPGISGNLTIEEALHRLLAGTGVTYTFTNVRALRIERGALPEPGTATLDAMTVTGSSTPVASSPKYTAPLRDVPQTVTVVSHDVIEAQGATSLRDVIKNVPGITINAGEGGSPPGDNFNVRGFSARSDLFVDGVRDIGGYSRDAFDLEQVEVAEGPASAYSGRGSINLVTKTPHLGTENSVMARAATGIYHNLLRQWADA
ncbi:MAG TPA: TonB-dependent receptor plug domain-containing protein [Gemmatimonadaceae bacterium]|jgi:catecholate siderophore receptor